MDPATHHPTVRRATLLLGYGEFGRQVLQRLLTTAALRDVLRWEEPAGATGAGQRQLRDLEILLLADRAEGRERGHHGARHGRLFQEESTLELFRDLYSQIREVGTGAEPERELADALVEAARRLLAAPGGGSSGPTGPDLADRPDERISRGLDVLIVARPESRLLLGNLNNALRAGMDRLKQAFPRLHQRVEGAEAIVYLAILDFDDLAADSAEVRQLRQAVAEAVRDWETRRNPPSGHEPRPAPGRIYILDAAATDGIRDRQFRIDEISLFLEFLLFEGQRADDLQRLYQAHDRRESALATFGIRLFERSDELLSKLAAARFGARWLDSMAASPAPGSLGSLGDLGEVLGDFSPGRLERRFRRDELGRIVEAHLRRLEGELLRDLQPSWPDWPAAARSVVEARLGALREELASTAGCQVPTVREDLAGLAERCEEAIRQALHRSPRPAALGGVLAELEHLLATLGEPADGPGREEDDEKRDEKRDEGRDEERGTEEGRIEKGGGQKGGWGELTALHAAYLACRADRLNGGGEGGEGGDSRETRAFWALAALVTAVGWTPLLREILGTIPPPDPTASHLLHRLHGGLTALAGPIPASLVALGLPWVLGRWGAHPGLMRRASLPVRFFTDPERGRLSAGVRRALAPGGWLRRPEEQFADELVRDLAASIRREVRHIVSRHLSRLRARRQEVEWLRDQLTRLLGLYGLSAQGDDDALLEAARKDHTGIRHRVESVEDFERILASNPPQPGRFASVQAAEAPFTGWSEPWGRTFVYPLQFIDRLAARHFSDPRRDELSQPGGEVEIRRREQQLLAFLGRISPLPLACDWGHREGVPVRRVYAVLPALWKGSFEVRTRLADLGVPEEQTLVGSRPERAYVLGVQLGVDLACLEGGKP